MLLASVQRSTTVGLPTDAAPAWFGLHSEALDAYVARAIRLATDKPFYFAEKQKLWSKRSTAPLFDTEVRHRRTKYSMHRSFNITARGDGTLSRSVGKRCVFSCSFGRCSRAARFDAEAGVFRAL